MPLRHFGFRELMGVGGVATVTLLAKREIVALLTIESVVALFNRFEAIWVVTNEPHIVALILMPFI